uniref:Uncharacterized protein n=1 Tax=Anguilla anguilla TaxID=7936 RepID=A0A0E9QE09_ANGAN
MSPLYIVNILIYTHYTGARSILHLSLYDNMCCLRFLIGTECRCRLLFSSV